MSVPPAARPILLDPHPLLRQVAAPVTPAELRTAEMQEVIDDMFATVRSAGLIGLAAPQIGVSRRLFVVDFEEEGVRRGPIVMANPHLLRAEGEAVAEEGSPCRPGGAWRVRRAWQVRCRGLDRLGRPFTLKAKGLLARCVAHEMDHLDGVMCFDRVEEG